MASNSKKRRRVLGASCILAALIIASSSFAWFTSKDEVTNRLSSNADYGVSIVESFTPPENWSPGQNINKDVYAINTGNVEAFVNEDVTGKLTYTVERLKTQAQFDANKCLTLTADEVDKVKAGAYLAGAFATDGTKITSVDSGAIAEYFNNGALSDPLTTADFTPDTTGLYFFRRSIGVADDGKTETFTYDGYYFDATTKKYYEVKDIRPNEAQNYHAGDGNDTDGVLTVAPTYKYVQEETATVTPALTYEAAVAGVGGHPQRLVATYNTNVGVTATDASNIDTADAAITGTTGYLKNLNDAKTVLDAAKAAYEAKVGQKNAAITTIAYYAGETNAETISAVTPFTIIGSTATSATAYEPGDIVASGVIAAQISEYNGLVPTFNAVAGEITTAESTQSAKGTALSDAQSDEADALDDFDDAKAAYTAALPGHNYDDDIATIGTPSTSDAIYTVWQAEQAYKAAQAATATAQAEKDAADANVNTLKAKQASLRQKLIDLGTAINANVTTLNAAIADRDTYSGQANDLNPAGPTDTSEQNYLNALDSYNNALKAYNEARAKYEANDKTGNEIKIYINLSDKVTTGKATTNDQWQLIPIDVQSNIAHFFYTGILGSGDSSSKLIDSVELAPEVSQNAYKFFDFDLNVGLDSAQVVYADDQKTILTTAVEANTDIESDAELQTPTALNTVVYWN